MASKSVKYIYLTRHYFENLEHGQVSTTLLYMHQKLDQYDLKNQGKQETAQTLTNIIKSLFMFGKYEEGTLFHKQRQDIKPLKFKNIDGAFQKITEIEKKIDLLLSYFGTNGIFAKENTQLRNMISKINNNQLQEKTWAVIKKGINLANIFQTKFKDFPQIKKATDNYVIMLKNMQTKTPVSFLGTLNRIKFAAVDDCAILMQQLKYCYIYILKQIGKTEGKKGLKKEYQNMIKGIKFDKYVIKKGKEKGDQNILINNKLFKPKVKLGKNTISLTYSNINLRVNKIIKKIQFNFDNIIDNEFALSEIKDPIFLYHFANLAQMQIGNVDKAGSTQIHAPVARDLAVYTLKALAANNFMKKNKINGPYWGTTVQQSTGKYELRTNFIVKTYKDIMKQMVFTFPRTSPWSNAINLRNKQFFSGKPERQRQEMAARNRHIINMLRQQKIRIAVTQY